ncbi:MAG: DNA polymerase III subunit epsilon [Pseudomonadota bacterium]
MREIVFDTETTGFDPENGDRIVEIGCVEILNQVPTGNTFHVYINPERDMPQGAFEVHGLSEEFLSDKPVFAAIAEEFMSFVGDGSKLVAHNASFDMKFINAELKKVNFTEVSLDRVVDTLAIARRRHPMGPNSLDALCSRYGIDNSRREKHGALLDAELLADVYIELLGGRQRGFDLVSHDETASQRASDDGRSVTQAVRPSPLPPRLTDSEEAAHKAFVDRLGDNTIWQRIWDSEDTPRGVS